MKRYGLVGHPLGHSFSKAYFTEKFEKDHLDCCYQNFDLQDIATLSNLLEQHPDLCGFNVTVPYKEAIIPYLDKLDPIAAEVGAVNTVKILSDRQLKGFNTDVIGVEEFCISHSALILGSGGASKAVQYALKKNDIFFHLVSRDATRGDYTYSSLTTDVVRDHLVIINATPVGMFPKVDVAPLIPYDALTSNHILIDLIYNPEETLFLRKGRERGAVTFNGLKMLYAQAEAAWAIWNQE
jgi:shikimate dehydrogenase